MYRSTAERVRDPKPSAVASGPGNWLCRSLAMLVLAVSASPALAQREEGRQTLRDREEARDQEDRRDRGESRRADRREREDGRPGIRLAPDRDRDFYDRRQIVLGVYADPVGVGYLVEGVVPGTPAHRMGIEPGDRIVAVDSYQVGRVGGRLYRLDDELQRRASGDRHAVLLVQNVRNRELLNLDVDFARPGFPGPIFGPRARAEAGDAFRRDAAEPSEEADAPQEQEANEESGVIGRRRGEVQ